LKATVLLEGRLVLTHNLETMKFKLALIVVGLFAVSVQAQPKPNLSQLDRIRLAEAFSVGNAIGNRIWKDWDKAPFAVLLVTPEYEFLIRHPKPTNDFTLVGHDDLLKSDVYFRKRQFQVDFQATFPAVGGVSTIVVGQVENTASKTSTPWVVTLMHEHFHQLQDSQPNFFEQVAALNLAHGDQSGMWMLNYKFPYDGYEVRQQFFVMSRLLADALKSKEKDDFAVNLSAYLTARQQLREMLSADDYKYLSFQLWKEGIARYTEYHVAKLAAADYKPTKAFAALKDFTSYQSVADQVMNRILSELSTLELEKSKRVSFYAMGAGEGLSLDRVNPQWRDRYLIDKFSLDTYFKGK
jgi:hypothetical protein